jgi:hypothetical protein
MGNAPRPAESRKGRIENAMTMWRSIAVLLRRLLRVAPRHTISGFAMGMALLCSGVCSLAQTVSPVIVEYKAKAQGQIALVNNTLTPLAVVLEPRSFSIAPDGNGVYRPLDADIHVKLSSMSFRIEPGQTHYVFYSATADKLPAWFTVYSVFSKVEHGAGLDVRILLPHTVYIYPKKQPGKVPVQVVRAVYSTKSGKVECDLENNTPDLTRVQEVEIAAGRKSQTAAGFPLLPGERRHLEVSWNEKEAPETLALEFAHNTLKQPIGTGGQ